MYNSFSCGRSASPSGSKATTSIDRCTAWQTIPRIGINHCAWPARLSRCFNNFSPGLWVIPPRCYWRHNQLSAAIHRGSHLFYRFKTGHSSLAFPLALIMSEVLRQHGTLHFDCIVPIPLSPDKQETGQLNRTRILAQALAALLRVTVADVLSLSGPISKRQFLSAGLTQSQFEHQYRQILHVNAGIRRYPHILLLDDVCTEGSTLNSALQRIRETHPHSQLSATTAGQMILKSVVTNERLILGHKPPMLFTDLSPQTR